MRRAGILCAISSIPTNYGVGDFGKDAKKFIDIISDEGFKVWQILPLNPVGYGNSPYQPYSSYAGDEIYISLDELVRDDLLSHDDLYIIGKSNRVNYEEVRYLKNIALKKAYQNFKNKKRLSELKEFVENNFWVETYAKFITLKKKNDNKCWLEWNNNIKNFDLVDNKIFEDKYYDDVVYEIFVQYIFYKQWMKLKAYANSKGIEIMGDIPIYVGIDSAEVWSSRENFLLDDQFYPTHVAGVPPDYFSATGQRWGNPIYDWDFMQKDDFKFWINRLSYSSKLYDIIRIDHFRAFDTYWKIPSSCPTAVEGEWVEAPGYALFDKIFEELKGIKIVVEDLGDLRKEVLELRDHYNLSGMKIAQFELDPYESNNNFKEKQNTILYTGTHDNQTLKGWYDSLNQYQHRQLSKQFECYNEYTCVDRIIHNCLNSVADLVILPVQDILNYDDSARMNTPGTIGSPNWEWRMENFTRFKQKIVRIGEMLKDTNRK